MNFRAIATFLCLAFAPLLAHAQGTLLQGGSTTMGHVPMYATQGTGQPVVIDSGTAAGGGAGVGLSELSLTARGTGTTPYVGQGTGPLGTNLCDYDAPTTNATGYHYLCFSANATGNTGMIAFGAGGVAAQIPLVFNVNGTSYAFPFSTSGIVGPGSTVVGDPACWNNTVGTLLKDCTTSQVLSNLCATSGAFPIYNNTGGAWVCSTVGGTGSLASLNGNLTVTYNPTTDLASGFAYAQLFPLSSNNITVGASKTFSIARISQTGGGNNTFTIGANSIVSGFTSFLESNSGSDATSNIYGSISHCINDGPGTCKGIHAEASGGGSSTGVIVAVNGQIQPVATSDTTGASFYATLTSTGVSDRASGYLMTSAGDRYLLGFGATAPINYNNAAFRAYMGSGSGANARALQIYNNSGVEIGYWNKDATLSIGGNTVGDTVPLSVAPFSNSASVTAVVTPNVAHFAGQDGSGNQMVLDSFGASSAFLARRADGAASARTQLVANDTMININGAGWTSSAAYSGAAAVIRLIATESYTNSANGSQIDFRTTPNGTTTIATAMSVLNSGALAIGTTTNAGIGGLTAHAAILSEGATAGIGYTTGSGGSVTQSTNKSTAVTLNTVNGAITMNSAALGAATIVSFTLTDSAIGATDVLVLNHISGGTVGSYTLNAQAAGGSATINVRNNTAGSLSEAIVIEFAVIKGVIN